MGKAEERLEKKIQQRKKALIGSILIAVIISAALVIAYVSNKYEEPEEEDEPIIPSKFIEKDGQIIINTTTVDDGELHHFKYVHNDTKISLVMHHLQVFVSHLVCMQ
jgi:uncharacterized membrane protein